MGIFGGKQYQPGYRPGQKKRYPSHGKPKGIIGRAASAIAGIFRSEAKPTSPEIQRTYGRTAGTRGYALGTRKQLPAMQEKGIQGVTDWTTGRKWTGEEAAAEKLGSDEVDAFVLQGEFITVHSTWLFGAQYFREDERMMVQFRDNYAVLVNDISEREAVEFAIAPSKGIWFWDNVLGRGTTKGHRLKTWTVL